MAVNRRLRRVVETKLEAWWSPQQSRPVVAVLVGVLVAVRSRAGQSASVHHVADLGKRTSPNYSGPRFTTEKRKLTESTPVPTTTDKALTSLNVVRAFVVRKRRAPLVAVLVAVRWRASIYADRYRPSRAKKLGHAVGGGTPKLVDRVLIAAVTVSCTSATASRPERPRPPTSTEDAALARQPNAITAESHVPDGLQISLTTPLPTRCHMKHVRVPAPLELKSNLAYEHIHSGIECLVGGIRCSASIIEQLIDLFRPVRNQPRRDVRRQQSNKAGILALVLNRRMYALARRSEFRASSATCADDAT